jgi:hypothetical protein
VRVAFRLAKHFILPLVLETNLNRRSWNVHLRGRRGVDEVFSESSRLTVESKGASTRVGKALNYGGGGFGISEDWSTT